MAAEPATGGSIDGPDDGAAGAATVDSRWWYVLAAVPVVMIVSTIVGIAVVVSLLSGAMAADPGANPDENPFEDVEIGTGAIVAIGATFLIATIFSLLAPVAFYFDAGAVSAAGLDWEPDPVLWAVLGVVGLFFQLLLFGAPLYYLYQRHKHVGTP